MLFQRIEELEQQKTELTQTLESARQPTTPSAGVAPESHEGLQRNMSLLQVSSTCCLKHSASFTVILF